MRAAQRRGIGWTAALGLLAAAGGEAAAQAASGPRLLVLLRDAGALAVVDPAAGTVLGRVPNALLVRPDGGVAYAALRGDDRVAVIDLETLEVAGEIPTGAGSGPGCMFWLAGE